MHDVHRAYPSTTPSARSNRRFIPVPSVLFHEFIADGSKLARRHRLVTLVGEIVHARAVIRVPRRPQEHGDRARGGIATKVYALAFVDDVARDVHAHAREVVVVVLAHRVGK